MFIYTILSDPSKDLKKHIMEILWCSSYPFKRWKNLVVSNHTYHIILIGKTIHSDIRWKLFYFSGINCAYNSFLSIQSNAWNIYYRSEANLISHFILTCRHLDGIILTFFSLLKWFWTIEKFLTKANASQSGSEVKDTVSCSSLEVIFPT